MLRRVDLVLGALLLIGALLHMVGSWIAFGFMEQVQIWSFAGGLAAILLAVMNMLRAARVSDRPLAWVCVGGLLGWIGIVIAFGVAVGSVLDPRALYHLVVSLALLGFALRSATAVRIR